jgi:radial spoke head protein 4A
MNTSVASKPSSYFPHHFPSEKKVLKENKSLFQDWLKTSKMLKWAGLGFSEEDNYRLSISLRLLLKESGAKNLKFWGKIQGKKCDYYVAMGEVSKEFKDELPLNWEPRGQGINKFTYWVTDDLFEKWIELPLISPEHVKVSRYFLLSFFSIKFQRKIKYIFSGDLERSIKRYPKFIGKEKHLLKANIVRITFGTTLVPTG